MNLNRVILVGAIACATALSPVLGSSAQASVLVFRDHQNLAEGPFPDEVCGVPVTIIVTGVESFWLFSDGTFRDTISRRILLTSTAGRSVTYSVAGARTGLDQPIANADGTVTFVTTVRGLPEKFAVTGGGVLTRDAGTVTIRNTVRPIPGTDGFEFVSQAISGEHGPHPELDGRVDVCALLVAALS